MQFSDFILVTPCLIDIDDGTGPHRPLWQRIIRRQDLESTIRYVPTYSRTGEKIRDIRERLPDSLSAAYQQKHGSGMINRCYLDSGAIFTPFQPRKK